MPLCSAKLRRIESGIAAAEQQISELLEKLEK